MKVFKMVKHKQINNRIEARLRAMIWGQMALETRVDADISTKHGLLINCLGVHLKHSVWNNICDQA